MLMFATWYIVCTRLRVILVAGLCYVPFLLYVVLLVPYKGRKSERYTRVRPTANAAHAWGSIALSMLEVCHRVQTNKYAAVLTYRQLCLYTSLDIA